MDLILALTEIETSSSIKSEARLKASGLKAGLCKYETILTAQTQEYFKNYAIF